MRWVRDSSRGECVGDQEIPKFVGNAGLRHGEDGQQGKSNHQRKYTR
jgi:hypothetical protein